MNIHSILIRIIIVVCLFAAAGFGGHMDSMYLSIAKQIKEWKIGGADKIYDRINGGAELYLTYDFKEAFAWKYFGPGDSEIVLDIYDMGSLAESLGGFTSEREADKACIGQPSTTKIIASFDTFSLLVLK